MKKTCLFLYSILLFWACEPIPFDLNVNQNNSMCASFYSDNSPSFAIYYTSGIFSHDTPVPIEGVTLKVWEDNILIPDFNFTDQMSYMNPEFKPKPGAQYKIKAEMVEGDPLLCNFTMPGLVKFDVLNFETEEVVVNHYQEYYDTIYQTSYSGITDSIIFIEYHEARNDTVVKINMALKINDPQNTTDYYYLIPGTIGIFDSNIKPHYTTLGPVEEDNNGFYSIPMFADDIINEQNNIVKFSAYYGPRDSVRIELSHFDEFTYNFNIKTFLYRAALNPAVNDNNTALMDFFKPAGIPETEPVILPQNVENGIGVITSYSVYKQSFAFDLPPESEWKFINKN